MIHRPNIWLVRCVVGSSLLAGCAPSDTNDLNANTQFKNNLPPASAQKEPASKRSFLDAMPLNNEKQCIGIAIAMEQLENGNPISENQVATSSELANTLYNNLLSDNPIDYPGQILLDSGEELPIDSKESLEEICHKIANLYKNDFAKLIDQLGDTDFRNELTDNHSLNVASTQELDELFTNSKNQKLMLSGFGERQFPEGTIKGSSHAFILAKQGSQYFAYDPNDPGKKFEATLEDREFGAWISWTSAYRDPNIITTQGYYVRTNESYFTRFFELLK